MHCSCVAQQNTVPYYSGYCSCGSRNWHRGDDPFLPYPLLWLPCFPCREAAPLNPAKGPGELCKLPCCPVAKRFFMHFESKIASGCNNWAVFLPIFSRVKDCCTPVGDTPHHPLPLDPPLGYSDNQLQCTSYNFIDIQAYNVFCEATQLQFYYNKTRNCNMKKWNCK